jgi:Condensation domain
VPISWSQERAWQRWRAHPDDPAMNVPLAVRIRGPLWIGALRAALSELLARQELLRARLTELPDGRVVQRFEACRRAPMLIVDLSRHALASAEAIARALAAAEAGRAFVPDGDLWRATLVRFGVEDHALLVTLHDTIGDPWSMDAFGIDLLALYRRSHTTGEPADVPWPIIQYADWGRWQREWLASPPGVVEREYWRGQLAGLPRLGLDGRALGPRGTGVQVTTLDGAIAAQLRALAEQADATPYMVLVAAIGSVLASITGQTDIAIGCPTAGRSRTEFDRLIGPFLNPLVLRLDLTGEAGFMELLQRVRTTALAAYSHHEVPYGALVADLGETGRAGDAEGLFEVSVVAHRPPAAPARTPEKVAIEPFVQREPIAWLPLEILSFDTGEDLHLTAVHRTDCLSTAEVADLLTRVQALLSSAAGQRPVGRSVA